MDKITEAIAHFIGLFNIAVEEARLRKDYDEFTALQVKHEDPPEVVAETAGGRSPYAFGEFDPGLRYTPLPPDLVWVVPWSHANLAPPRIPDFAAQLPANPAALPMPGIQAASSSARLVAEIDPPGQIAVLINQMLRLSDSDYVGVGGSGLRFDPTLDPGAKLASLLKASAQFGPLSALHQPGSGEEIGDFVAAAPLALDAFAKEHPDDDNVAVVVGEDTAGLHINGRTAQQAPKLDDLVPGKHGGEPDEPARVKFVAGEGELQPQPSLGLEAGGNTLVNEAFLSNNWLVAGTLAALGDYISLNAIVQANVWSDSNGVGASLNGWTFDPSKVTKAFNIAAFQNIDPSEKSAAQAEAAGNFPKAWAVTEIHGDFIQLNWIQQFNFVIDNDIHMLAASGVTTMATSGANTSINSVSLYELGSYYDLIIIGGSIYDGNLIQQLNVLLDDDLIGSVAGFQTTGQASASTSGNLLWNSAEIVNIGGTHQIEAMPEAFRELLESFAAGSRSLSSDVLRDEAFAGLEGLRVLYISGNLYNLNYIEQNNVLGDADQVALAMGSMGKPHPGADWTLATGENALVNIASIVDADFTNKAYVNGQHYSDEVLIQAEFVSTKIDLGGRDPDVLVNEAVAFLDDDMIAGDASDPGIVHHQIDAPHLDVMQSMLS